MFKTDAAAFRSSSQEPLQWLPRQKTGLFQGWALGHLCLKAESWLKYKVSGQSHWKMSCFKVKQHGVKTVLLKCTLKNVISSTETEKVDKTISDCSSTGGEVHLNFFFYCLIFSFG